VKRFFSDLKRYVVPAMIVLVCVLALLATHRPLAIAVIILCGGLAMWIQDAVVHWFERRDARSPEERIRHSIRAENMDKLRDRALYVRR
jgi:F0F1-type ATP synthase assembly protein I